MLLQSLDLDTSFHYMLCKGRIEEERDRGRERGRERKREKREGLLYLCKKSYTLHAIHLVMQIMHVTSGSCTLLT